MRSLPIENNDDGKNYIVSAIFAAFVIIPLTKLFAPNLITWSFLDVWNTHGTNIGQWLSVGLPIFAWGFGITTICGLYKKFVLNRIPKDHYTKSEMFWDGTKKSILAGVFEEIAFRWLIYYGAFTIISITNFFFFDWAGLGLPEVFHNYIWGPLANLTTLGYLEPWIFHPSTWLVGAAMLYSNAFFRDGHKYLGLVGVLNAWFIGMFLFYVMFTYGLLAAIIIHFTYDWLIFSTRALIWGE